MWRMRAALLRVRLNELLCCAIHRLSFPFNHAQLPHQAKLIYHIPVICNLILGNPQDVYDFDGHLFARSWYSEKLSLGRPMKRLAGHDLVSFSNLVVNHSAKIREGCAEHSKELFDSITVRRESR